MIIDSLQTEDVMTLQEQSELARCEAVIERGIGTFMEVGAALLEIRDSRLYREQFNTFEEYCRDRWGLKERRAYQLMDAAKTVHNLEVEQFVQLPRNEAAIRPMTTLPPDKQREAWARVIETAPDGHITAGHVQQVVDEIRGTVGRQKPKTNRAGDEYEPQGFDACQTPPLAVDPLLPFLDLNWTIWEPAAGEQLLVEAFYDSGFTTVIASDLLTGQNFFDYLPDERWDCLITNPPYSLKYRWLERCYALDKPFALLLPVETLGAQAAQNQFRQYGVEVIFLDRRINFKMPLIGWEGSAAQFPVAWFTWGLDLGQQMTFARLARADHE